MGLREDLQRKLERKQAELIEQERLWDLQKAGAEAYIQALQEVLKSLPRDASDVKPQNILRAGGAMAKVRELILAHGKPLHISDILKGLGKPTERNARASVSGALGAYVRRGEVFVRTGPNTFGLVELGHSQVSEEEPPPGFGSLAVAD